MFIKVFIVGVFAAIVVGAGATIDEDDVKYFLYTDLNPKDPIELSPNVDGRSIQLIDPKKSIKILCHGYTDTASSYWIAPTKDAFMAKGEKNIISVDWSKHAYGLYSHAHGKARPVGEHVADLVMTLAQKHDIPYSRFHLIGHSLGSHIFGFAGKKIYETTGEKIGRITGMDPAGPLFNGNEMQHRLNVDDALFVDAIHTDTTILGYKKSLAHADFWPNGGGSQKGCSFLSNCSHLRAPIYFYESIASTSFPAWNCDSIKDFNKGACFQNEGALMGDNCNSEARGNFYLNTNNASPFGIPSY